MSCRLAAARDPEDPVNGNAVPQDRHGHSGRSSSAYPARNRLQRGADGPQPGAAVAAHDRVIVRQDVQVGGLLARRPTDSWSLVLM